MCSCIVFGVDFYVFADGIDYNHEEFQDTSSYRQCTTLNIHPEQAENCPSSTYGTYLASLTVGKSVGVAPKANVYRYVCVEFL